MGCNSSTPFVANNSVLGQDSSVFAVCDLLKIGPNELNQIWAAFNRIDKDHSGFVSMSEFHDYYGFEETPLSTMLFSNMALSSTDAICFEDFLIVVWDYLSTELHHFVFNVFDKDKSHTLHRSEIKKLVQFIYGVKYESNHKLQDLVHHVRTDASGNVHYDAFVEWTKRNQLILWPAYVFQRTLREDICGEGYWAKVAQRRDQNKSVLRILRRHEPVTASEDIVLDM